MAAEGVRFRRQSIASGPPLLGLVALLLLFALLASSRALWEPRLPEGALVEVVGDVPRPGTYLVDPATVGAAVGAAGGTLADEREVPAGYRVVVSGTEAVIQLPDDPLVVALPVDVNLSGAETLSAIPGIGLRTAEAIVADREASGAFYSVDELRRVRGVGATTLEALRPFVTIGEPGERPPPTPLDLNRATATELERLPGIGPVTAARIVVDREDRGAYRSVADLVRVKGIGPKTLERVEPLVVVP